VHRGMTSLGRRVHAHVVGGKELNEIREWAARPTLLLSGRAVQAVVGSHHRDDSQPTPFSLVLKSTTDHSDYPILRAAGLVSRAKRRPESSCRTFERTDTQF